MSFERGGKEAEKEELTVEASPVRLETSSRAGPSLRWVERRRDDMIRSKVLKLEASWLKGCEWLEGKGQKREAHES